MVQSPRKSHRYDVWFSKTIDTERQFNRSFSLCQRTFFRRVQINLISFNVAGIAAAPAGVVVGSADVVGGLAVAGTM